MYMYHATATKPLSIVRWLIEGMIPEEYSCFENGCPVKPYATMPRGIMGNGGSWSLLEA